MMLQLKLTWAVVDRSATLLVWLVLVASSTTVMGQACLDGPTVG